MAVTSQQINDFYNKMGPLVIQVCEERGYGNAQSWTCMAQAACESAYGTSSIMANAHAYFGVKAYAGWVQAAKYGGLVYNAATKECYDGKTYTSINDCFRAYKSDIDSIRDYFDLMETSRYNASLTKDTVLDCITVIKNGGYATAPDYINTIMNFYNSSRPLIESFVVNAIPKKTPSRTKHDGVKYLNNYIVHVESCLRVRKEPNTTSEILGSLKNNTYIYVKEKRQNWGYVPNLNGWVCLDYCTPIS